MHKIVNRKQISDSAFNKNNQFEYYDLSFAQI